MSTALFRVLGTLSQAKGPSESGWYKGKCPAHEDRRASLGVRDGDRGVILKCQAGCAPEEIVKALGLEWRDLFDHEEEATSKPTVTRTHRYPVDGVFHVRLDLADGFKRMHWEQADGTHGLGGRRVVDLPLYAVDRLGDLPDGTPVCVTEGERATDALLWAGFTAVGTVTGASTIPSDDSLRPLVRLRPQLWPDDDEPGRRHMDIIAVRLAALGCRQVEMVTWPDAPEHGDAADFIEELRQRRLPRDEMAAAVATIPRRPWSPAEDDHAYEKVSNPQTWSSSAHVGHLREGRRVGVLLSDVEPEPISWLWRNRIARGKVTLIDGDPGLGKSVLSIDWSARVSRGLPWPDGAPCPTGGVVILTAEDGIADTVRPRLDAAGGLPDKVLALQVAGEDEHPVSIPGDLEEVELAIRRVSAVLLIVDPLAAFLDAQTNSRIDHDVRRALRPLATLAERTGVAVLVIRHLNKTPGGPAIYRGGGSIGIIGAARIALLVGSNPEDEEQHVLAAIKTNIGPKPAALAYRLTEARNGAVQVAWEGESSLTADQLLAVPVTEEDRGAVDEAAEFLSGILASGPVAAGTVKREAERAGIGGGSTLRRAQRRLGIKPRKLGMGAGWAWGLPAEDDQVHGKMTNAQGWSPSAHVGHLRATDETADEPAEGVWV